MTLRDLSSRLRDQYGLTLVEVLAALAVIEIGVLGVVVVVPGAIHGVHEGYHVSTATFLAEQALERARAATWSEGPAIDCLGLSAGDTAPVPTGTGCYGSASTQFPDEIGVAGHPHHRRAIRVTPCASEPCAGAPASALRRVEVVVGYTPLTASGVSATEKTIRLESLVTPR